MTLDELETAVGLISYKPGWTFTVARESVGGAPGGAVIYVRHMAPDASAMHPGCLIPVVAPVPVNGWFLPTMSPKELQQLVRRHVLELERHEMDEWLMYDGRRVRNPHPEIEGYGDGAFRGGARATKGTAP